MKHLVVREVLEKVCEEHMGLKDGEELFVFHKAVLQSSWWGDPGFECMMARVGHAFDPQAWPKAWPYNTCEAKEEYMTVGSVRCGGSACRTMLSRWCRALNAENVSRGSQPEWTCACKQINVGITCVAFVQEDGVARLGRRVSEGILGYQVTQL